MWDGLLPIPLSFERWSTQRHHAKTYATGLDAASNKTVAGIAREILPAGDKRALNCALIGVTFGDVRSSQYVKSFIADPCCNRYRYLNNGGNGRHLEAVDWTMQFNVSKFRTVFGQHTSDILNFSGMLLLALTFSTINKILPGLYLLIGLASFLRFYSSRFREFTNNNKMLFYGSFTIDWPLVQIEHCSMPTI